MKKKAVVTGSLLPTPTPQGPRFVCDKHGGRGEALICLVSSHMLHTLSGGGKGGKKGLFQRFPPPPPRRPWSWPRREGIHQELAARPVIPSPSGPISKPGMRKRYMAFVPQRHSVPGPRSPTHNQLSHVPSRGDDRAGRL